MTAEEKQSLLEELLNRKRNVSVKSSMNYYLNDEDFKAPPLAELLSLDDSELTATGKRILEYLETTDPEPGQIINFESFKRKVQAFLSIQDMLFPPYFDGTSVAETFQLRYFYYESKYILTEAVVSGLNGLHIGNNTLLRLFLEFNLTQLYYYNTYIKDQSIKRFRNYIQSGIKPSNGELIKEAIASDNFCAPIRKRVQLELQQLANRYSHAYAYSESPKAKGIHVPHSSLESIHFYVAITGILDAVLWMYYASLPMLFVRLDVFKRFGFDIPPGFFATPSTCTIVRQSLPPDDFALFKQYAEEKEMAKANIHWYNSLPDLSEEEIWDTGNVPREEGDTIISSYIKRTSQMRAQLEMSTEMIRRQLAEGKDKNEEINLEQVLDHYVNFSKFRKVYQNLK